MDMEVGHTLADSGVYGNKRSVGIERGLYGTGHPPNIGEQQTNKTFGEGVNGFIVRFGNQEAMAAKERADVEESKG
jgi:hypothetical protein